MKFFQQLTRLMLAKHLWIRLKLLLNRYESYCLSSIIEFRLLRVSKWFFQIEAKIFKKASYLGEYYFMLAEKISKNQKALASRIHWSCPTYLRESGDANVTAKLEPYEKPNCANNPLGSTEIKSELPDE